MESRYYSQTPEQVLAAVESREEGLTSRQAQERLERFGPNALREEKKKPVWQVFLEQFKNLLVVILIAAAVISMLSGNVESTIVIFAVLILNAVLGTVQHCKAEKSLESLKAMSAPTARVLRDGERLVIPSAQIVPGDIVELEAGDMVVADGRILHNYSLKVNESSLTGESEGVEKTEAVIEGDKVALGDRKNLVFSGSLVTYGRALVVITGTGMDTELGKVAALMNQTQRRKTPLQESLDQFSRRLAMIILVICVGVFALSLYHAGGFGTQAILDPEQNDPSNRLCRWGAHSLPGADAGEPHSPAAGPGRHPGQRRHHRRGEGDRRGRPHRGGPHYDRRPHGHRGAGLPGPVPPPVRAGL